MSSSAARPNVIPHTALDRVREARRVLAHEAAALTELASRLDASFADAAERVHACRGNVIVTGMGKAGLVGRKIAATLASMGTNAHFLHPAEAVHGDLGCLHADDLLLALSNSGETDELCRLLPIVRSMGITVVAVTASATSTLGRTADVAILLGTLREADAHGLAPTTSTTAMLAVGDALAIVVSRIRGFTPREFAALHPAGSLGLKLRSVRDAMRVRDELRVASEDVPVRELFVQLRRPGRRTGAVMLVDAAGRLTGIFTDSDLARLLERRREDQLDRPVSEVMTRAPLSIDPDALLLQAIEALSRNKVSELPVVDAAGQPVGLIDITDVIGLMPQDAAA